MASKGNKQREIALGCLKASLLPQGRSWIEGRTEMLSVDKHGTGGSHR